MGRLDERSYDTQDVDIIVVGCGDWELIKSYKREW